MSISAGRPDSGSLYPYLQPETPAYELARALYMGEPLKVACRRLGVKIDTAHSALLRLRRRASAYAGREVNEIMALRLLFDVDRAKADLFGKDIENARG